MRQFLVYCICGGIGVSVDYAAFYLAVSNGLWYQFANVLGYASGTVVSFVLNRWITFGARDYPVRRFMLFLAVAGVGFTASAALLWVLVDVVLLDARLGKLLTLPLVVILQFSLNRRFTFHKQQAAGNRGC